MAKMTDGETYLVKKFKRLEGDISILKFQLAQLETETLELRKAAQALVDRIYGEDDVDCTAEYDRIVTAIAQPAISKLMEAKHEYS